MMTVKRVAAAVRLMDMVTGAGVEPGSVSVDMKDGGRGIWKDDGYLVFWDNGMVERHLVIESPYYEREVIVLDTDKLRRKRLPSMYIWLKPGPAYPYSAQTKFRETAAEPGQLIRVLPAGSEGVVRLAESYPYDRLQPELIALQVPEGIIPEGRPLQIRRLSDGCREDFTIWQTRNRSAGLYELTRPLKEVYSVYDEAIGILLEVRASADGICRIPEAE